MTLSSKENKLLCGHREGLQPWHSLHYSVCKTIYAVAKLKLQLLVKKRQGGLLMCLLMLMCLLKDKENQKNTWLQAEYFIL